MVVVERFSTIFTTKLAFADLFGVSWIPSGSLASVSHANTGRSQKAARPIPLLAVVDVASTLQALLCMLAAAPLLIMMGGEG